MTMNPNTPAEWDAYLDAMLSSDDGVEQALNSDNPILRAAARLCLGSDIVLPDDTKARIWSRLENALENDAPITETAGTETHDSKDSLLRAALALQNKHDITLSDDTKADIWSRLENALDAERAGDALPQTDTFVSRDSLIRAALALRKSSAISLSNDAKADIWSRMEDALHHNESASDELPETDVLVSHDALVSAALALRNSSDITLSDNAKADIWSRLENALDSVPTSDELPETDVLVSPEMLAHTANTLHDNRGITLSGDAKARIWSLMEDAMPASADAPVMENAPPEETDVFGAMAALQRGGDITLADDAKARIWLRMEDTMPANKKRRRVIPIGLMRNLAKFAAVFTLVVFVGFGAQPAAASTLPGSWLYPVKMVYEQIDVTLAQSPDARMDVFLSQAEERMHEWERLSADSALRTDTLLRADEALNRAVEIGTTHDVFAHNHLAQIRVIGIVTTAKTAVNASVDMPDDVSDSLQANFDATIERVNPDVEIVIRDEANDAPLGMPLEITPEPTAQTEQFVETMLTEEPDAPTEEFLIMASEPDASTTEADDGEMDVVDNTETDDASDDDAEDSEDELWTSVEYVADSGTLFINTSANAVNVRAEPSVTAEILGAANRNIPVTVLGITPDGTWRLVSLPNGLTGWVANFLLGATPIQTATSTTDSDTSSTTTTTGTNATTNTTTSGSAVNANASSSGDNANASSNGNNGNNGNGNGNSDGNGNAQGEPNRGSSGNAQGDPNRGNGNGD